ncbi:hypothetical protein EV360DRAFT_75665 [Lentinula raphanica]|nr:hypothetical protein EV360DRAFT_75665 [Lentinula raphanica]
MAPNHEFSNTPLRLESELEDWAEDAEHWVKVLCQDCTLGFSAAINQQGSIKLQTKGLHESRTSHTCDLTCRYLTCGSRYLDLRVTKPAGIPTDLTCEYSQTSTRKVIMSDVKSAYEHISLKVSKEAASLNGSYMQQYEALSEALIGIMAFSKIAEEAGRLYPNVKNEGGQDSRMELFLDELVKICRSATRAKMQKAEAAAKEVKNSTPGAKGKESSKAREKTVERASVEPLDAEQKFMEEIVILIHRVRKQVLPPPKLKTRLLHVRPVPRELLPSFVVNRQVQAVMALQPTPFLLIELNVVLLELYRKGTPVKVADQDSPASPKAKSKSKSKKKSKVVEETPEPMADPDMIMEEEPKPKAKAKGTNAEEETAKASKGKGKRKRQDQDVGAAESAETSVNTEPYSTTAGPETIVQPMTTGEEQTKRTKVYLDLADTCDPGDSQNWDLVRLLQDITRSHAAEYSNYTEAQFNALVNFHENQLFDCSIKARFYVIRSTWVGKSGHYQQRQEGFSHEKGPGRRRRQQSS